jgi:PAS domain S-box-containing protein
MTIENASELATAIIEQAADAVVFADLQGVIRLWNPAAEALYGFTAAEALGQSLDLIIPENLRKPHWAAFDRAIQSGATRLGGHATVTRALHKSSKRLYVDLSFAVVKAQSGAVVGATAVGRDVTSRFEEEKAMRSRLRELEGGASGKAPPPSGDGSR